MQFGRAELPARFSKLCGNKAYLAKRIQNFEGPGWAGEGK